MSLKSLNKKYGIGGEVSTSLQKLNSKYGLSNADAEQIYDYQDVSANKPKGTNTPTYNVNALSPYQKVPEVQTPTIPTTPTSLTQNRYKAQTPINPVKASSVLTNLADLGSVSSDKIKLTRDLMKVNSLNKKYGVGEKPYSAEEWEAMKANYNANNTPSVLANEQTPYTIPLTPKTIRNYMNDPTTVGGALTDSMGAAFGATDVAKMLEDNTNRGISSELQASLAKSREAQPVASTIGGSIGSVAKLMVLSQFGAPVAGAVGGIGGGAAQGAITGAISGTLANAGDVVNGKQKPEEFIKNVLVESGSRAAGSIASGLVGQKIGEVLTTKESWTMFAEYLRQLAKANAYTMTTTGIDTLAKLSAGDKEGNKEVLKNVPQQLLTNFMFSLISSAIATSETVSQSKANLQARLDEANRTYRDIVDRNNTWSEEETQKMATQLLAEANIIKQELIKGYNNGEFAGQQDMVNTSVKTLDNLIKACYDTLGVGADFNANYAPQLATTDVNASIDNVAPTMGNAPVAQSGVPQTMANLPQAEYNATNAVEATPNANDLVNVNVNEEQIKSLDDVKFTDVQIPGTDQKYGTLTGKEIRDIAKDFSNFKIADVEFDDYQGTLTYTFADGNEFTIQAKPPVDKVSGTYSEVAPNTQIGENNEQINSNNGERTWISTDNTNRPNGEVQESVSLSEGTPEGTNTESNGIIKETQARVEGTKEARQLFPEAVDGETIVETGKTEKGSNTFSASSDRGVVTKGGYQRAINNNGNVSVMDNHRYWSAEQLEEHELAHPTITEAAKNYDVSEEDISNAISTLEKYNISMGVEELNAFVAENKVGEDFLNRFVEKLPEEAKSYAENLRLAYESLGLRELACDLVSGINIFRDFTLLDSVQNEADLLELYTEWADDFDKYIGLAKDIPLVSESKETGSFKLKKAEEINKSKYSVEDLEPAWNKEAKTGEKYSAWLYRGQGKSKEEIYNGTQYPLLGKGTYYALSEGDAKRYGNKITSEHVELKNPLVIQDDSDWKSLTKKAGWEYANPFGLGDNKTIELVDNLKDVVQSLGHDGIIVKYAMNKDGDTNTLTNGWVKTIDKLFGHDQVVVYGEKAKPLAKGGDKGNEIINTSSGIKIVNNEKEGVINKENIDALSKKYDIKSGEKYVRNSMSLDRTLMKNAIDANRSGKKSEGYGFADPDLLNKVSIQRQKVVKALEKYKNFLPPDIPGEILKDNASYGKSAENSYLCPRLIIPYNFVETLGERLGHSPTHEEQFIASEVLAGITGMNRDCTYCFNLLDAQSYKALFNDYYAKYKNVFNEAKNNPNEYKKSLKQGNNPEKNPLYKQFLTKKTAKSTSVAKATDNQWARYTHMVEDGISGKKSIMEKDLASRNFRNIAKQNAKKAWFINDAEAYCRSSAQPLKTQRIVDGKEVTFVTYNGSFMNQSKEVIDLLNSGFGLRMYSYSDPTPHSTLEDVQLITDASVRGSKVLAYCKNPEWADMVADTNTLINISTFGDWNEKLGTVTPNEMMGASWEQAKAVRAKHKNAGIVFVATSDEAVDWALDQKWIDVVIPFHTVRMGQKATEWYGYTDHKGQQEDKKIKEFWSQKGWSESHLDSIPPTIHGNDLNTYLKACEENGLEPRFKKWWGHKNYMKLVNETRLSYKEAKPVQPRFDTKKLLAQVERIGKEGGYGMLQGLNPDQIEQQNELIDETMDKTLAKIKEYKKSKGGTRNSSEPKVTSEQDKQYLELAKNPEKNKESLQKMVKEAAKENGYTIPVYHGTLDDFTTFDISKNIRSRFGKGIYVAGTKKTADHYGSNVTMITANERKGGKTLDLFLKPDGKKTIDIKDYTFWNGNAQSRENINVLNRRFSDAINKAIEQFNDDDLWDYSLDEDFVGDVIDYTVSNLDDKQLRNLGVTEEEIENGDFYYYYNKVVKYGLKESYASQKEEIPENVYKAIIDAIDSVDTEHFGKDVFVKWSDVDSKIKSFGNDTKVIEIKNIKDGVDWEDTIYVVKDNTLLKDASPVTYDDNGNVIPLSERFDKNEDDIRKSTEPQAPTEKTAREMLRRKSSQYLNRAENYFVNNISSALGASKYADRSFVKEAAQKVSNEYLETGTISEQTRNELFDEAYEQARVKDEYWLSQNKRLSDEMKNTIYAISDSVLDNITDSKDWLKDARKYLRFAPDGESIDSKYKELADNYPDMFPDITNEADQIEQILDVAKNISNSERTLEQYHGDSETFKEWSRRDFDEALNRHIAELNRVKRFNEDTKEKRAYTVDELKDAFKNVHSVKKSAEKAVAKNLLTTDDNIVVGRLLRGEETLEGLDPEKYNVKGIKEVYEAKKAYEDVNKVIKTYNAERKAKLREEASGYLKDSNKWKDKSLGLAYARETMERNFRDIIGSKKEAQEVVDYLITPVHKAEASKVRYKDAIREKVKKLDLSRKVENGNSCSESFAVQFIGEAEDNIKYLEAHPKDNTRAGLTKAEWQEEVKALWANNPNLDKAKISKSIEEFRKIYDKIRDDINNVYLANGYEPVPYRSGYFMHFMQNEPDGVLGKIADSLGIRTDVTNLPTTINGQTGMFRPGRTWFGSGLERKGNETIYDAVLGIDKYLESASDVIFQTENIQRLRQFTQEARYRTSDEGLQKQMDEIRLNNALTEAEKDARIAELYSNGKYALSNLVVELDEYTNLLANKKSKADRVVESFMGRSFYNIAKALEQNIAGNMVTVNIASQLTNLIPIVQANAVVDSRSMLRGMWDTLRGYSKEDGFVNRSDYLTSRFGSDNLVARWEENLNKKGLGLVRQKWEQGIDKIGGELVDSFASESIVRARYYQNINSGMSEANAIDDANAFAASLQAARTKGAMPTLFGSKNPAWKLLTQFQLEVNNTLSWLFKDVPDEAREKGKGKLFLYLLKYAIGAFLFNEFFEFAIGRRPAPDPLGMLNDTVGDVTGYKLPNMLDYALGRDSFETDKKSGLETITSLGKNVAEELPLVGGLLGGGRVPISGMLPDVSEMAKAWGDAEASTEYKWSVTGKELGNTALYLALPGGASQVSKTTKGLKAVSEGGSYKLTKDGTKNIQYPVWNETTGDVIENSIKGALFGKSSYKTARDWVEKGFPTLNDKYTSMYDGMVEVGVSQKDAWKFVNDFKSIKKTETETEDALKEKFILDSNVSDEAKSIAYDLMQSNPSKQYTQWKSMGGDPYDYLKLKNSGYNLETERLDKLQARGIEANTVAESAWKKAEITDVKSNGFSSYEALKKAIGGADTNEDWHHIVEQTQKNKLDETKIQNSNNVVSIVGGSQSMHSLLTAYYGSKQDFTNGKTVREWLSTKSFEEQWQFGAEYLEEHGTLIPGEDCWTFIPNKTTKEIKEEIAKLKDNKKSKKVASTDKPLYLRMA